MANPGIPDFELERSRNAAKTASSVSEMSKELNVSEKTVRRRLKILGLRLPTQIAQSNEPHPKEITYPTLPEDDIPTLEIINMMKTRHLKRKGAEESRRQQVIRLNHSEPVVIALVGDPHLDDDGCDWTRLEADIELMNRPYVYAVNVGDTTNNWTGKLMRLFAHQETSQKTARKLAKWFLTESGIKWLVWVLGNHDEWESGGTILRLMNTTGIVMEDWSARFRLGFKNGIEVPFWVAHDFPGHSQWNKMHGLMKAAMMRGGAGVYAAGHRHDPAIHWEPIPDQEASFWALRSRGYKIIDHYATVRGYPSHDDGHTTAVVIDPREKNGYNLITGFKDLRNAVIFRDALANAYPIS